MGCVDSAECCSGTCSNTSFDCQSPSPILINLRNSSNNYHLTPARDGVRFDIDADGDTEQVSWTEADSEVAFLVMDRNGNGIVDDGSELFGNYTRLNNGQRAPHGFEALLDLDGGPDISDGRVDSRDSYFAQLRLWTDRNHNGISEPAEVVSLSEAGVTTIFTTYRETSRIDRNGNSYRYLGRALVRNNGQEVPRHVFDVFLRAMPE
jgi:hypothetical protein